MDSGEESNYLLLTRDILDVGAINSLATASHCGAITLFVGTTRDNFERKKVLSLEYEAYEPMALKEMEGICIELRKRWPDIAKIAIYHRIGLVPVGEASVVIAISSPHRVTSLEAVATAIEELKKRVPIWKKEKYEGDESAWKENKESTFDERCCSIQENDSDSLPSEFVQISATEMEIQRRIQCFVEKKREEIDLHNIMDYARPSLNLPSTDANENETNVNEETEDAVVTCARTNSTIIKQDSSKGHLKVSQTENYVGPQIRHCYVQNSDGSQDIKPKMNEDEQHDFKPQLKRTATRALLDRIENMEDYLNMFDDTKKDINKRVKALEERLLYLESLSPEYRHFWHEKPQKTAKSHTLPEHFVETKAANIPNLAYCNFGHHKEYSVDDIDKLIEDLS